MLDEGFADTLDCQKDEQGGQTKPELSLEAKSVATEAALLRAHHEKTGFSEKGNNVGGKLEGNRKRGGPNTRWIDCLKEPTGLNRSSYISCILTPWFIQEH